MTYPDPTYPTRRYSYAEQYRERSFALPSHPQPPITVKVEDIDNSDLLPNLSSHSHYPAHQHISPYYRFGGSQAAASSISSSSPTTPVTPFTFMSGASWPSSSSHAAQLPGPSFQQPYPSSRLHHSYVIQSPIEGHGHHQGHVLPHLADEYDDADDDGLTELPPGANLNGYSSSGMDVPSQGTNKANEKQIRRRSSKACDQCRKSKCKCERSSPQEPCKNCVLLGTTCTFLGPSRKRGPPKGYIDAIEARLHQTEALIGILLASKDSRAKTLLEDLSEDALAKEIIDRVNNSSYGYKGRKHGSVTGAPRTRPPETKDGGAPSLQSTHPSNEWQDSVTAHLNARASQRNTLIDDGESFGEIDGKDSVSGPQSDDEGSRDHSERPSLTVDPTASESGNAGGGTSFVSPVPVSADRTDSEQHRRQRRRVETEGASPHAHSPSAISSSGRSQSPTHYQSQPPHPALLNKKSHHSLRDKAHSRSPEIRAPTAEFESDEDDEDASGEDELAIAVGQLSINEDSQVRYHGKVSGLHLLNATQRDDGRSEGGIWRFPKARVWPPLPATARTPTMGEDEWSSRLPTLDVQEHLLELYFTYVHAQLPIVHKASFMDLFRTGNLTNAGSPSSQTASSPGSQSSQARAHRIPALLLLAMFSIAARYSTVAAPPPEVGAMWAAGDSYMEDAKVILDSTYAQSRPSTCQALLLLGYREIGIGAMAQAWLYIGMAVRMAQDLGLHKNADKWSNVGKTLFGNAELQERRRIWYGCVVMDKYVSSYIGRPVAIFEHDFDTELPDVEQTDEMEPWCTNISPVYLDDGSQEVSPAPISATGHVVSCFNESAKLSIILSMIMQTIYPIRPHTFRQPEFNRVEQLLQKWYIDLPDHLRFDGNNTQKYTTLPPHILTLHMQYWCTVLLLHRPFIRHMSSANTKGLSPTSRESELRANSRKHNDQCVQAANQITSVVSVYIKLHCPRRASVFLCYYVFTAAITHVSTLRAYPGDPTASIGLRKCVNMLERMQRVWPSAWRANELLYGTKVLLPAEPDRSSPERTKRVAEPSSDDAIEDARAVNGEMYRQPHTFAGSSPNPSAASGYPLELGMQPAEAPAYYHPHYARWAADSSMPTMASNLSTSVLPQQYSTGLDDRLQRTPDRHGRYPQYWNDYSALGQIDATYGMPVMDQLVPQHSDGSQGEQQMYVPDQFSIYNNLPTSNNQ